MLEVAVVADITINPDLKDVVVQVEVVMVVLLQELTITVVMERTVLLTSEVAEVAEEE
jgi:hypothetical protein